MVRKADPVREALAFFRDLGVSELYVNGFRAAAYADEPAGEQPPLEVREVPSSPFEANRLARRPGAGTPAAGDNAARLLPVAKTVAACRTCRLCETRTQTVFSDGSPNARIMFVGEAPGADEDAKGIPFVGRAGQLLTKMIEDGMGISRKDVYIANVLKCRPPDNRSPEPDEIASCRGYLEAQIDTVRPDVIVALGKFAAQFLLDMDEGIMRLRGRWGTYRGIPVMPTFHPSFLLRQPERKREAWEDLLKVLAKLGIDPPRARKGASR
jgi:uracil-DNA glycosylase family 4